MALAAGTRLGVFEILAPLGKGGMGEVYRAKDTKLERDVAVKLLPSEVARDTERLARFQREAHLLASLNHPNIAAIYGLEEADGKPFLVLELVDGEELSARVTRGAIPIEESTEIARQIAEALEEAHEHGIIHRDLKPANIKLTHDGKVKVLDFGLAKAYAPDEAEATSESQSPTISARATAAGLLLGTAAYMSPEQARGKPVDKRADIWAYGVVLFEMLTGKRLFTGETVSDTLASILKEEPDWTLLPVDTPRKLSDLLHRCMRKDVRNRLHDIGDARIEIEEAMREERGESLVARGTVPPSVPSRRAITFGIFIVAAIAVAGAAAVWQLLPEERLIYLMDTAAPLGVYDATTRSSGGTNADDLSDLLGDLPVSLAKEAVSPLWRRHHQVMLQRPDLIVIHRSAFAHQPGVDDREDRDQSLGELERLGLENPYALGWSKLVEFLGYIALGSPRTRFVVYGRGFSEREHWIADAETRYPQLRGKITAYEVPRDADGNASFNDPSTGEQVKQLIASILGID